MELLSMPKPRNIWHFRKKPELISLIFKLLFRVQHTSERNGSLCEKIHLVQLIQNSFIKLDEPNSLFSGSKCAAMLNLERQNLAWSIFDTDNSVCEEKNKTYKQSAPTNPKETHKKTQTGMLRALHTHAHKYKHLTYKFTSLI